MVRADESRGRPPRAGRRGDLGRARRGRPADPRRGRAGTTYAPVLELKDQPRPCEAGEPYEPTDIDLLMGNDEIALRGPWDTTNIVSVAPRAAELGRGLFGYHLDFPGDPLRPGCTYEQWSIRLRAQAPPTAYARAVTQPGHPGRLALQYWFFYVFNDWNNTHEGDWEMIQLNFDADTPEAALASGPAEAGYSQHSSAERAAWGDEKLEVVDGTHPVVYPAAGSHANFFDSALYLMRSDQEGVGCDDTTGPSRAVRPAVETVPTAPSDYLPRYPWLGFDGRWGEQQAAFFNGPTGPNDKTQWTEPFTWAAGELAGRELRGAGERGHRDHRDRLLLRRRRAGLPVAAGRQGQPRDRGARHRGARRAAAVGPLANRVAARRPAAGRPPPPRGGSCCRRPPASTAAARASSWGSACCSSRSAC